MTIDEIHEIEFGGMKFPYFPDTSKLEEQIKKSMVKTSNPKERAKIAARVSSKYDETLILSNLLMDGFNMDFDGDKVAFTLCLTKQANDEALAFLNDPQAYFSLEGNNQRVILNKESISGIYGLTKDDKDAPPLKDNNVLQKILENALTDMRTLVDYTLDDYDEKTMKIIPSKCKVESVCTYKGIKTTVGRAFFNAVTTEVLGLPYINEPCTKEVQSKLLADADRLVLMALEKGDKSYFTDTFIPFLDRWERLTFACADAFGSSLDMNVYATSKEYDEYREKLMNDNRKEIEENGNLTVYDEVEKKLIEKLKEIHKKEGVNTEIFDSGSKLSYQDDLRNGLVCVGPMPVGVGAGKYKISLSSLLEGTTKKERATFAQSNIVAGYFRAMGPATGGTIAKEILAATHDTKLGKKGSDCKRTVGQVYLIDDYMADQLDKRYIIEKGSYRRISSSELKEKYMGKHVMFRAAHFCAHGNVCNVCAGDMPYIVAESADTINIGAQKSKTGDEITQASLSKFHSSKTEFVYVDLNDYIVFESSEDINESVTLLDSMNESYWNISESVEEQDDLLSDLDGVLNDVLLDNAQEYFGKIEEPSMKEYVDVLNSGIHTESSLRKTLVSAWPEFISLRDRMSEVAWMNELDKASSLKSCDDLISMLSSNNYSEILTTSLSGNNDRVVVKVYDRDQFYGFNYDLHVLMFKVACGGIEDLDRLKSLVGELYVSMKDCGLHGELIDNDDGSYFLYACTTKYIPSTILPEEDINEAVSADQVAKGKSEVQRIEKKMRKRLEDAISQLETNAANAKKKARQNMSEALREKEAKLEVQRRNDRVEYRKRLERMMVEFDMNYDKANKFKMQKARNKLNFIYNKKCSSIDASLADSINHIKMKNKAKTHENITAVRIKYGI